MIYAKPKGVYHIYETPDAETGYCALARKATPEKWIEATPDAVPVCKRCFETRACIELRYQVSKV